MSDCDDYGYLSQPKIEKPKPESIKRSTTSQSSSKKRVTVKVTDIEKKVNDSVSSTVIKDKDDDSWMWQF